MARHFVPAKVCWTVTRHVYWGGVALAHEAMFRNRYVSIENLGKDYKEMTKYELQSVPVEDSTQTELKWVKLGVTSFERMKDAKTAGEAWLQE